MLDNTFEPAEADAVHDPVSGADWHKKIKDKNKKTALIVAAAVLLLTIARVVSVRLYVDPEAHFYTAEAMRIFDYAMAAVVAGMYIVGCVVFYKYKIGANSHRYYAKSESFIQGTQTLVFTAAIAGCVLVASAGFQIWNMIAEFGDGQSVVPYLRERLMDIFIFVTAVLSSVYFFRTAARDSDISAGAAKYSPIYSQWAILLSMMPILWSFANTFRIFFDMSRSINSPIRVYELMCFLALSLYFVSETRMLVGRHGLAKYFTFAYIATLITALSAVPNLMLSSFWIMQTNDGPIVYAVQAAFILYMVARVYSQLRYGRFGLQPKDDDGE